MQAIELFLEWFKNFSLPNKALKDAFIQVVFDKTGAVLSKEEIDVRDGLVRITTNPTVRVAILIKQTEIVSSVQQKIKLFSGKIV